MFFLGVSLGFVGFFAKLRLKKRPKRVSRLAVVNLVHKCAKGGRAAYGFDAEGNDDGALGGHTELGQRNGDVLPPGAGLEFGGQRHGAHIAHACDAYPHKLRSAGGFDFEVQLGVSAQVLAIAQNLPTGPVTAQAKADGVAALKRVGLHFLRRPARKDLRRTGASPGACIGNVGIHAQRGWQGDRPTTGRRIRGGLRKRHRRLRGVTARAASGTPGHAEVGVKVVAVDYQRQGRPAELA